MMRNQFSDFLFLFLLLFRTKHNLTLGAKISTYLLVTLREKPAESIKKLEQNIESQKKPQ